MYKKFKVGILTGLVEVWRDIPGFEDSYQVSSFGRVKSKDRFIPNKWSTSTPIEGCFRKLKASKSGYLTLSLSSNSQKYHFSVHRLVASVFIPNGDNKPTVNHLDGEKKNNNVLNLEWSTHSEQMEHASNNNLLEVRGNTKYSPQFKKEVWDYYTQHNCSIIQVAKFFNISERSAGRFCKGTSERRLKVPDENIKTIVKMRKEGFTLSYIAQKFNCSISQVHRIVNKQSRNLQYER